MSPEPNSEPGLGLAILRGDTEWLVAHYDRSALVELLGNPVSYWDKLVEPWAILGLRLGLAKPDSSMLYYSATIPKYRWALRAILAAWKGDPLVFEEFMSKPIRQIMFDDFGPKAVDPIIDFSRACGYSDLVTARDIVKAAAKIHGDTPLSSALVMVGVYVHIASPQLDGLLHVLSPSSLSGEGLFEYTFTITRNGKPKQVIRNTLPEGDWIPDLARQLIEAQIWVNPLPVLPDYLIELHTHLSPAMALISEIVAVKIHGPCIVAGLLILGQLWRVVLFDMDTRRFVLGYFETVPEALRAVTSKYGGESVPQPL